MSRRSHIQVEEDPKPEDASVVRALDRVDFFLSLVTGGLALIVYLLTLGPTVTGEDSGELIAAAYTMGIPHPPGYPTWTMLAHLFTYLPMGDVGWRVNLMSAIFAALSVALTYLLCRKLSLPRWAAVASALAFAFSRELWEQSVIAEVYSLNAFFFGACLLLLLQWYERRQTWTMLAFGLCYGLSLGNHNTMMLLGPCFVLFLLFIDTEPWHRWGAYIGGAIIAIAAAVLVHLYLPIRSAANPPVDWGNPETWTSFKDVVTRAQYSFMFTEAPRSIGRLLRQTLALGRQYIEQFSPWMGILALPGLIFLCVRDRLRGGFLLATFVWVTLGYLLLLNTKLERESMWVSTVFYIPSWLLVAVGLGAVLHAVHERVARQRQLGSGRHLFAAALVVVAVASPLLWNFRHNDRSEYHYARDFASNILKTLDQDAIYFPGADHATFPVMYLQYVEGMRPDVTIANKYGYIERSLYESMPGIDRLPTIPTAQDETKIEEWIIANTTRPVYFSSKRQLKGLPDYQLQEHGLLFRVVRPGETLPEREFWEEYQWHSLNPADIAGELTATYIISDVEYMQGRQALNAGDTAAAFAKFDTVAAMNADDKEVLNNLGSTCAEKGHLEQARRYLERAVAADGSYTTARLNLAKVQVELGDRKAAILNLEELLRETPQVPEAVRLSAESLAAIGWYDEALAKYQYLLQLQSRDASVYAAIGDIYYEQKKEPLTAENYYEQSLEIDASQEDIKRKLLAIKMPAPPEMPEGAPTTPSIPGLPAMPDAPQAPVPSLPGAPGGGIPSVPAGVP